MIFGVGAKTGLRYRCKQHIMIMVWKIEGNTNDNLAGLWDNHTLLDADYYPMMDDIEKGKWTWR